MASGSRDPATTGAEFLDTLARGMPFRRVRAGLLPARPAALRAAPCSPKLNGAVERVQRTRTEEFYEVTASSWHLPKLNQELRPWERIYNTVRPHQSLGYLTPQQFLLQWKPQRKQ